MTRRKRKLFTALLAAILIVCWYTEEYVNDSNGIPIHAISISDIRTHVESGLVYPGALSMSGHSSAQGSGTLFGLHLGTILPAQAKAIYQTTAQESNVVAWYEQWLRAHQWTVADARAHVTVNGIPFDHRIDFKRGSREAFSLRVEAFSGGTEIETLYMIKPFSLENLFD